MTDPVPSKDVFNVGHGHVYPRTDGVKARCGGPGLCKECSSDLAHQQRQESPSKDQLPDVKVTAEQADRVYETYIQLCVGGLLTLQKAARLIVHLQDKVAELEQKIEGCGVECSATMRSLMAENEKLESDLAWIRRRTGFWGEVPQSMPASMREAPHCPTCACGLHSPFNATRPCLVSCPKCGRMNPECLRPMECHYALAPEAPSKERAEFERWLFDEQGLESVWEPHRNCHKDFAAHLAFKAWQAARSTPPPRDGQ